jgi:hypothetical protein
MATANGASKRPMKTCSRGHHYRGANCPICWPGGVTKTGARRKKKPS